MMALRVARELGLRPITLYALHQARLMSGWYRRRTPSYAWGEKPLPQRFRPGVPEEPSDYNHFRQTLDKHFLFKPDPALKIRLEAVLAPIPDWYSVADEIREGRFRLFGGPPVYAGIPPNWGSFLGLENGSPSSKVDLTHHWSKYNLDSFSGDVKLLWEIARFGWVFPLARAFLLTQDQKYFETFWQLTISWRHTNAPNTGPHWISAQEVGLRLMALIFAMYAFDAALDVQQRLILAEMISVHAERIPSTLVYARAQGNNHLLVEGAALYSTGLLFPEFEEAARWKKLGRRWLESGFQNQVFRDGGYLQHSTNYQRLAIQVGLWSSRLAELNDEPISPNSIEALRRMTRCLIGQIEPSNGHAPNFGPNDGALFLPLSTRPIVDYRPTIQAGSFMYFGEPAIEPGPWDELSVWLGLSEGDASAGIETEIHPDQVSEDRVLARGKERQETVSLASVTYQGVVVEGLGRETEDSFPQAGLHFLRGRRAWGMLRAVDFKSRPGHSDQLHFDLWWRGINVARDPGTYLYNGSPPWNNPLAGARYHNTVVIDGMDPMTRAGRFLWIDWAKAEIIGRWRSEGGSLEGIAAVHTGYQRDGIIHQRTILRVGDDLWVVVDDLLGDSEHSAVLRWLLPDCPHKIAGSEVTLQLDDDPVRFIVESSNVSSRVRRAGKLQDGEGSDPRFGWHSSTYAVKDPAIHFEFEVRQKMPIRFVTTWLFNDARREDLQIDWRLSERGKAAITGVRFQEEHLDVNDAHSHNPPSIHIAE